MSYCVIKELVVFPFPWDKLGIKYFTALARPCNFRVFSATRDVVQRNKLLPSVRGAYLKMEHTSYCFVVGSIFAVVFDGRKGILRKAKTSTL